MMQNFLKEIGVKDADTQEQRKRKYNLVVVTLCCLALSPIWAYASYLAGLRDATWIPLFFMPLFLAGLIIFSITKNEKALLNIVLFTTFTCPFVVQWYAGGMLKGGIVIMWCFMAPLIALIFGDIKRARIFMTLMIMGIVVMTVFNTYIEQWGSYISRDQKLILLAINITIAIFVTYIALQYFVKQVAENKRSIEEHSQRSDSLLLNILPEHVAHEIKMHGKSEPTLYENTTIIFSDFKDFTQFSELFTPEELIGELAMCFDTFDEIITRHGLEKIKTIGDAYMCVGGISADSQKIAYNAEKAVLAAMEMAQYIREIRMQKLSEGKAYWDVRIGVHTGDVVAGVVGKKKFVFDIWGDAVNVANRLQTCSEEGKINISDTTYRLVKDYFLCSPRGRIAVKNKGELDMYFVDERIPLQ
jgi:class 3 adenylate cyclase